MIKLSAILTGVLVTSVVTALLQGCVRTNSDSTKPVPMAITPSRCMEQTSVAAPDERSTPTANSIYLVTLAPAAGSQIDAWTVVVADLAFSVKNFEMHRFEVMAQFDTRQAGYSTDGDFAKYPILKSASGRIRMCFPMRYVWYHSEVKKPYSVRFLLNKIEENGSSEILASTERIPFVAN